MGMTDKQFESYQSSVLRELKRAQRELAVEGVSNETINEIIEAMENELKRP